MKNIEQQIEDTLNSLNGVQRVAANPYLLTRAQQKVESNKAFIYYGKWMMHLTIVTCCITAFTVFSVIAFNNKKNAETLTGIDAFAEQYSLRITVTNI